MSLPKYKQDLAKLFLKFIKKAAALKKLFFEGKWLFRNYFLTNSCSLMCLDCPLWEQNMETKEMDYHNIPFLVNLGGGDPLYAPQLVAVLAKLKSLRRFVLLTSNGLNYLRADKKIFTLIDLPIIYMPGSNTAELSENTGVNCFHDYQNLFEYFREIKKKFIVQYTVTAENFEHIPEMVQLINITKKGVLWLMVPPNTEPLDNLTSQYLWYNDQKKRVVVYESKNQAGNEKPMCHGCNSQLETISIKNIWFFTKLLAKLYF